MEVTKVTIYCFLLIYASITDIKSFIVKDRVHICIIILALLNFKSIPLTLFGAVVLTLPFLYVGVKTNGIGGGDIKFIFANGLYLGFLENYVGIVIGLISVIVVYLFRKIQHSTNKNRKIPLIPHLALGYFMVLLSQLHS